MASTSRSLFLLSLLVSSFCMTVTASRSLQETNKLSLVDLDKILLDKHGLLKVVITCDLVEVHHALEILVENAVGDLVELKVVEGLVTKLKEPIVVKVSVAGTVNIFVKVLGKKVHVPLKLTELNPVLGIVGEVIHVVLKVVEGVKVLHIVNPLTGEIVKVISGLLP